MKQVSSSYSGQTTVDTVDVPPAEAGGASVLPVCLAVSLVAHALLIAAVPGYGRPGAAEAGLQVALRVPAPLAAQPPVAVRARAARPSVPQPSLSSSRAALGATPAIEPSLQASNSLDDAAAAAAATLSAYYPVELLAAKPRFTSSAAEILPPDIPAQAQGKIVVQLLLSESGGVDQVLLESSDLDAATTRRFISHLSLLKVAPGLRDGLPVKARWRLEFSIEAQPSAPPMPAAAQSVS